MNTQCSSVISLPTLNPGHTTAEYQLSNSARLSLGQIDPDRCINTASFERFLYWLGSDRQTAGRKYETIRARLIMMFRARQCVFAEDLADATLDRVARKLTYITTEFAGDPARYFYGVAKKIYLEYQHEIMTQRSKAGCSLPRPEDEDFENKLKQLDEALNAIPKADRELILTYYADGGKNKINNRRILAEQLGIGPNALRLRVYRIRRTIKNYMFRSQANLKKRIVRAKRFDRL